MMSCFFHDAWNKVQLWARTLQIAINQDKSYVFTTDPESEWNWRQSSTPGGLPLVEEFQYLGVLLTTRTFGERARTVAERYDVPVRRQLHRLQGLPLPLEVKGQVAQAAMMTDLRAVGLEMVDAVSAGRNPKKGKSSSRDLLSDSL